MSGTGASPFALETAVHDEVNEKRRGMGRSALTWDAGLAQVAREYCRSMARDGFFSHHSPDPAQTSPVDRVRVAGMRMESVGENLARMSLDASAREIVDGWMRSTGHRKNLLEPGWEVGGVGIGQDANKNLFVTHLFGIPEALALADVGFTAKESSGYVVRLTTPVGRGYRLVGYVNNVFAASERPGADGLATIKIEVGISPGRTHVSFGRARSNAAESIGFYDGWVIVDASGSAEWVSGWQKEGVEITDCGLFLLRKTELHADLQGRTTKPCVIVVDDVMKFELPAGAVFDHRLTFPTGQGTRRIDFGRSVGSRRYVVLRRLTVDSNKGTLSEESLLGGN